MRKRKLYPSVKRERERACEKERKEGKIGRKEGRKKEREAKEEKRRRRK